jgi:hypothetical protein
MKLANAFLFFGLHVMAGLVPAIHALKTWQLEGRGCPAQGRA